MFILSQNCLKRQSFQLVLSLIQSFIRPVHLSESSIKSIILIDNQEQAIMCLQSIIVIPLETANRSTRSKGRRSTTAVIIDPDSKSEQDANKSLAAVDLQRFCAASPVPFDSSFLTPWFGIDSGSIVLEFWVSGVTVVYNKSRITSKTSTINGYNK